MNTQSNTEIVHVKNLGRYYGTIKAVDDISFTVKKGEVLGFLGPNGAGKSTTMKILSCFISPSFGTASVKGFDILKSPDEVRKNLGYLPENAPAYEDMTVIQFLDFIAQIRGIYGPKKKQAVERAVELVSLKDVLQQSVGTLSKGFKRRVCFAQAVLHDPEILILDEPTDGLDPNQKFEVRELIRKMSRDKVIILSTHILEEVDEVCSRALIISKGKLVADGTPEELRKRSRYYKAIHLSLEHSILPVGIEFFKKMKGIVEVKENGNKNDSSLVLFPEKQNNDEITDEVIKACKNQNWKILAISVNSGNLAEVFREITTT